MNHNILIIEDNVEMQELMKLVLEQNDYDVTSALTGSDALSVLSTGSKFMMILLDLTLPDMRAQTFLDIIKQEKLAIDVPILFCSAMNDLHRMILPEGVVGVIQKPFKIEKLLNTIELTITENTINTMNATFHSLES